MSEFLYGNLDFRIIDLIDNILIVQFLPDHIHRPRENNELVFLRYLSYRVKTVKTYFEHRDKVRKHLIVKHLENEIK